MAAHLTGSPPAATSRASTSQRCSGTGAVASAACSCGVSVPPCGSRMVLATTNRGSAAAGWAASTATAARSVCLPGCGVGTGRKEGGQVGCQCRHRGVVEGHCRGQCQARGALQRVAQLRDAERVETRSHQWVVGADLGAEHAPHSGVHLSKAPAA